MIFYLNCLFLGEASARSIPVNISEEITVDDNKIKYEEITVSNVKSLILSGKKLECDYSLDKLNLWKVDRVSVNKNDEVLETFSTEDDIKENLGGGLMNPRYPLSDYFDENSFKDKKNKRDIHIIVYLLPSIGKCLPLEQEICSNKISIWPDLFFFALKQVAYSKVFYKVLYL